jgi:hypothetical protein
MEQPEVCYFCGKSDHMACFRSAYGAGLDAASFPEQRAA